MRIDKSLPALLLAAILGTALSACQRQPTPSARGVDLPTLHGERFGAPPGPGVGEDKPARPGSGQGFDPHHRRPPGPVLIAT